jgi:putative phosphoribosyl transferase
LRQTGRRDRRDAGKQLAAAMAAYKDKPDAVAWQRQHDGVPVAYEIAQALHLPLDLMLVRKLGVPGHEELAMGAIATGNIEVLNLHIIRGMPISEAVIEEIATKEHQKLQRRNIAYRHGNPPPALDARTVILVDDGCTTGATMQAVMRVATKQHAGRIAAAVPVISGSAYELLENETDEVICLDIPEPFLGVGNFYRDFSQTSDEEINELLKLAGMQ